MTRIKKIVIKAKVGNYKEYSLNNTAVYLEVLKVFRDDVGISKVIKLYGSNVCCLCLLDFQRRFLVGSIVYVAVGLEYNDMDAGHTINNPDNAFEEFWEFYPSSCLTVLLTEDGEKLTGAIAPDISEYPLSVFEERLNNCSFSLEELHEYQCMDTDYLIYPNPTEDGTIHIENMYKYSAIKHVEIIDISGRSVYSQNFEIDPFQRTDVTLPHSGLYIIAFTCAETTFYKKVIAE